MMNLDIQWQNTHSRFNACSQRRRVEVGSHLYAAFVVHLPEIFFRQFEVFTLQRQQVWLFKFEHLSGGLLAFADYAREVFPTAFQQRFIQRRERRGLWHWNKMIAAKEPCLALNAALLVTFARRTKRGVELPMRAEGNETIHFLAPATAKNFLDRASQVVVPQLMKDATEIMEGLLMCGEEGLLRGVKISLMKHRSAPHTSQREKLKLELLSGQFHHSLIPIDLRLNARVVSLRNENFAVRLAVSQFPELNILTHRALSDRMTGKFIAQPLVDAMRSMPLFTRRLLILDQNLIDEISHRIEHGAVSLRHFARRRDGVLEGLSHHPPMHTELPGDAGYRADTKLIFTSDLFKELHFVSPRH